MRCAAKSGLALLTLLAACTPRAGASDEVETAQAEPATAPKLVVLGIAQDAGVPQAACDSPNCEAARRDPSRRARAASLALGLRSGEVHLFDATPDLREQLDDAIALARALGAPPPKRRPVASVFLTHAHMGHYLGLAHFGFEAAHTDHVPVHGTARMTEFLASNAPWEQLVRLEEIALDPLPESGGPVSLGEVRVTGVPVPHRAEYTDTVAYRIEGPNRTALFIPDCDPWARWASPPLDLFEGVDVALVDATFYSGDELPGRDLSEIGHPLIVDTMDLLEPQVQAGELEVIFIHLNHSNPALDPTSEARRAIEARGFRVARRGEEVAL